MGAGDGGGPPSLAVPHRQLKKAGARRFAALVGDARAESDKPTATAHECAVCEETTKARKRFDRLVTPP